MNPELLLYSFSRRITEFTAYVCRISASFQGIILYIYTLTSQAAAQQAEEWGELRKHDQKHPAHHNNHAHEPLPQSFFIKKEMSPYDA